MNRYMVGSFQLMKSLNKTLILNMIRTNGPISRAEIAKMTRLTPPTVTNIVGELIQSGLVVEGERGESRGGRRPVMLTLNASAFHVIGVDVGIQQLRFIATNLDARLLFDHHLDIPTQLTEERFVALLKDGIGTMLNHPDLQKESVIGIGIGMHGLVDPQAGVAIFAPNLNLHQVPLREELEKTFDIPVEVDNDVRAMALGESWFGHGVDIDNFICVNVGNGVGAGIIFDGRLYRGTSFSAGEIGHTTVDPDGPTCSCGNDGCLQALVAGPAIAARARRAMRSGRKSRLSEDLHLTGEAVYEAAVAGDELAMTILHETGRYLGIGIANMLNTLNPARVIIGGGVAKAAEFIMEPLRETVAARALETSSRATSIVTSQLGDRAAAIGAVTLVLHQLFVPDYGRASG